MITNRTFVLLLLLIGIVSAMNELPNCHAEDSDALKLKTERVVVFKDGYCLIVKEGTAKTDDDGFAYTYEVPDAAVLGSFWAISEDSDIKSMVAGWENKKNKEVEQINCADLPTIIKANIGRDCRFSIKEQKLAGKILKLLQNEIDPPTEPELLISSRAPFTLDPVGATHFILQSDRGDTVIKISDVKNLTIAEMVSTIDKTTLKVDRKKKLSIKFAEKNQDVKIKLIYFRPDVRWIPTYRIDLTDQPFEKGNDESSDDASDDEASDDDASAATLTAKVAMQGEILNEAEDLVDVPFHVVVGVPNFRFRGTPSPMVLEANMRFALKSAAPSLMNNADNNRFSNAVLVQTANASDQPYGNDEDTGGSAMAVPEELNGKSSQDLFVYELEPMTLKKGERASVPILETTVGYRDIYTWEIQVKHAETFAATGGGDRSPLNLSENKVWRQIELVNDTDVPWTTGSAMFMDGFQPLAQELLTYTSPGGTCRVPVTVAVDLRGKVNDQEVGREINAISWRRNSYTKVEGKISASLKNNKRVKVPVEVSLRFGGKGTAATNDGEIALSPYRAEDWNGRSDDINNSSLVSWKAEIEPGEKFEPSLNYEFLLRN